MKWLAWQPSTDDLRDSAWVDEQRSVDKAGRFNAAVLKVGHPKAPYTKIEVAWLFDPKSAQLSRVQVVRVYDANYRSQTDYEIRSLVLNAPFDPRGFRIEDPVEDVAPPRADRATS